MPFPRAPSSTRAASLKPLTWLVLAGSWRDVDPRRALLLAPAGLWLGRSLAGRVPAQGARTAAVVVALAGAVATTVRGLFNWMG